MSGSHEGSQRRPGSNWPESKQDGPGKTQAKTSNVTVVSRRRLLGGSRGIRAPLASAGRSAWCSPRIAPLLLVRGQRPPRRPGFPRPPWPPPAESDTSAAGSPDRFPPASPKTAAENLMARGHFGQMDVRFEADFFEVGHAVSRQDVVEVLGHGVGVQARPRSRHAGGRQTAPAASRRECGGRVWWRLALLDLLAISWASSGSECRPVGQHGS